MLKFLVRTLLFIPACAIALTVLPVVALRWMPPPTTSFMLQSPVQPVQYQWVPADQIADVMRKAVVASEDQKFWTHDGFDVEAMQKAMEHNARHKKIRGGSTISQQTAKNLFLWPGGGYLRKGIEAYFTVLMEALWSKQRILEIYLNVAEFGPGVYGVEAAARAYIGKTAARINAEEAARLAAVLPSPRRWRAKAPGPYVQSRAGWILRQMGYGRAVEDDEEPMAPAGDGSETDESTEEAPGAAAQPARPASAEPSASEESSASDDSVPTQDQTSTQAPTETAPPEPDIAE